MHLPESVAEALGRLAFEFEQMAPFVPMYIHLILAALFPIIIAGHGSIRW